MTTAFGGGIVTRAAGQIWAWTANRNLEVRTMRDRDRTTLDYVRPGAEQRGRLREDFDYNDLNRDGRLSLGEFIRFMGTVDEDITTEELQIGFDEIDTNRDGSIDFDEFAAWWNERA
jgi:calmodulin